jgi:hypothetical protein
MRAEGWSIEFTSAGGKRQEEFVVNFAACLTVNKKASTFVEAFFVSW